MRNAVERMRAERRWTGVLLIALALAALLLQAALTALSGPAEGDAAPASPSDSPPVSVTLP